VDLISTAEKSLCANAVPVTARVKAIGSHLDIAKILQKRKKEKGRKRAKSNQ